MNQLSCVFTSCSDMEREYKLEAEPYIGVAVLIFYSKTVLQS